VSGANRGRASVGSAQDGEIRLTGRKQQRTPRIGRTAPALRTAAQARSARMKAKPSSLGHFSARNQAASRTLRIVNLLFPPELKVTGTLKNLSSVICILPRQTML
jgi:hypothetical protein